jgi:hypothetical protein
MCTGRVHSPGSVSGTARTRRSLAIRALWLLLREPGTRRHQCRLLLSPACSPPLITASVASSFQIVASSFQSHSWRCRAHHLLDVRRWRSQNHTTIKARRRDVAANRDGEKRAADSARAKLAMAIKRGTIRRSHCAECGSLKTTAYIADPAKWREIVWICRDHRDEHIRGVLEREQARERQDAWKIKREWAFSVLEAMPPEMQAEILTLARRNPIFRDRDLEIDSPLYLSKVVSEVEKRIAHTPASDPAVTTSAGNDRHRNAAAS